MTTSSLVRVALFAALIAVLGLIPRIDIPFAAGVPITAQTLGVMLSGLLLGPRLGALAVLLFLFAVALGAPVLSGGRGGLGVFFGPTVGFLVGWVMGAWVCGWLFVVLKRSLRQPMVRGLLACWVGGIAVIYLPGIVGLALVAGLPLQKAALAALVFLPGDILKSILAAWIVVRLQSKALDSRLGNSSGNPPPNPQP